MKVSKGLRSEGQKRRQWEYILTALSSISCWAFFWAASMVIDGLEPNSLRKMKDMDVSAGC
jgi:hypothetical protein